MREDLPIVEFAIPGATRDRILAAIAAGEKTATSSLLREYEAAGESIPSTGDRGVVVGSDETRQFVVETTDVVVVPLSDVTLDHAIAEGEGYDSVDAWRADHIHFWTSPDTRAELDAEVTVTDETLIVLERFRLVR